MLYSSPSLKSYRTPILNCITHEIRGLAGLTRAFLTVWEDTVTFNEGVDVFQNPCSKTDMLARLPRRADS